MGIILIFLSFFLAACGGDALKKTRFVDGPSSQNRIGLTEAGEATFLFRQIVEDSGSISNRLSIEIPNFSSVSGASLSSLLGDPIFIQVDAVILPVRFDSSRDAYLADYDLSQSPVLFGGTLQMKEAQNLSSRNLFTSSISIPKALIEPEETLSFSQREIFCSSPSIRWSNPTFSQFLSAEFKRVSQADAGDANVMDLYPASPIQDDGVWNLPASSDEESILDIFESLFTEDEKQTTSFIVVDSTFYRDEASVDLEILKTESIPLRVNLSVSMEQPVTLIYRRTCL